MLFLHKLVEMLIALGLKIEFVFVVLTASSRIDREFVN